MFAWKFAGDVNHFGLAAGQLLFLFSICWQFQKLGSAVLKLPFRETEEFSVQDRTNVLRY